MMRVTTDISRSLAILSDPIESNNDLIIDSGCSDHMFNTNVQMTNYQVLNHLKKFVQVANGQTLPMLGSGTCGILSKFYYVPKLSHSLL